MAKKHIKFLNSEEEWLPMVTCISKDSSCSGTDDWCDGDDTGCYDDYVCLYDDSDVAVC